MLYSIILSSNGLKKSELLLNLLNLLSHFVAHCQYLKYLLMESYIMVLVLQQSEEALFTNSERTFIINAKPKGKNNFGIIIYVFTAH
jgi:hypothetical protein